MKKMILKYSLLILILVSGACSLNQSDEKTKGSKYCKNEIRLFSVPDSIQSIAIDYHDDTDSIMNFIENKLQIDLCWNMVTFGLELTNMEPVKVQLLKECDDGIIRCFRRFPEVMIFLNQEGRLMIGGDIIPIDSVKFWIKVNFPNKEEFDLEEVSIKWLTETPKDSIEKTLMNIIDGYMLNYEEVSQRTFLKGICELSESQVDSLKNILPFKVRSGMGRFIPPPPLTEEEMKELNIE